MEKPNHPAEKSYEATIIIKKMYQFEEIKKTGVTNMLVLKDNGTCRKCLDKSVEGSVCIGGQSRSFT